jgi:hypothetical protein
VNSCVKTDSPVAQQDMLRSDLHRASSHAVNAAQIKTKLLIKSIRLDKNEILQHFLLSFSVPIFRNNFLNI